jgi:hypothetical protein
MEHLPLHRPTLDDFPLDFAQAIEPGGEENANGRGHSHLRQVAR